MILLIGALIIRGKLKKHKNLKKIPLDLRECTFLIFIFDKEDIELESYNYSWVFPVITRIEKYMS